MRSSAAVLMSLLLLTACSGGTGSDPVVGSDPAPPVVTSDGTVASVDSGEPLDVAFLAAKGVESFEDLCEEPGVDWSCFHVGTEPSQNPSFPPPGAVEVFLSIPQEFADIDRAALGDRAARDIFETMGADRPDLTALVIDIHGSDHVVERSSLS